MPKIEDFLRAVPDSGISSKLASGVLKIGDRLGDPAYPRRVVSVLSRRNSLSDANRSLFMIFILLWEHVLPFRPFTS